MQNLDDTVDEERLKEEFSALGAITSVKIMNDEKGHSRGFGFVCFSKPDEASKAVSEMNGRMIANKPIYVALAQPKEVRRAQLEAQHAQRVQNLRLQQQSAIGLPSPMYPGAGPMFYPQVAAGLPPQARQGFMYPQQMMQRRWVPGAGGAAGGANAGQQVREGGGGG